MAFSFADIVALEKRDIAGITDEQANIGAAIAEAESGGNPAAYGDRSIGGSYGLWQVYQPAHPGTQQAALNPDSAVQLMWQISNHGTNWKPWSTFNNGAYKQYLNGPNAQLMNTTAGTSGIASGVLGSLFSGSMLTRFTLVLVGLAVVVIGIITLMRVDGKQVQEIIKSGATD